MKQLRNEEGFVIIIAVLILALLSIIGITAVNTSMMESHIVANMEIHYMEFYAAESGIAVGPLDAKHSQLDESWTDWSVDSVEGSYELPNKTVYDYTVSELTGGTGSLSDIHVYSEGTHPRGGVVPIEATFRYVDAFINPESALWVSKIVSANGNVSISGIDSSGTCDDAPGIKHVLFTTEDDLSIDKFHAGQLEGDPPFTPPMSGDGLFVHDMGDILKMADVIIDDVGESSFDLCDYIGETSADDPIIVAITVPNAKMSGNCEGYGMLYSTGNVEITGTMTWHGLVMAEGDMVMKGGGDGLVVDGSMVIGGDTTALLGNVSVQYNCEMLTNLSKDLSGYAMTSWRQL